MPAARYRSGQLVSALCGAGNHSHGDDVCIQQSGMLIMPSSMSVSSCFSSGGISAASVVSVNG